MGAIGGLLGLGGGASGTGFQTPQQAGILTPTSVDQANFSYEQNQNALSQQQGLLNAIKAQGGLQNQSNVFNQLQGVANGTGPNPAQAMLNQATGQNVANQAALMAGQRGASANVGLLGRQAAQQGGALQQQAAGQGAVMQANQSLNALGQLGGIANNQVANQMAAQNAFTNSNQAMYGNLLNALGAQNQAKLGSQSSVNAGNTTLAGTGMQGQQGLIGGLINKAGPSAAMLAGAHGGQVPSMADGGPVGPQSSFGQFLTTVNPPSGNVQLESPSLLGSNPGADALRKGIDNALGGKSPASPASGGTQWAGADSAGEMAAVANKGGMVDVVLSPGEKVVPPEKVKEAAGGNVQSKVVPGKAKVSGDSLKNDTYKTQLPEGSIVIPRSKAKDEKSAIAFVQATLAKRGKK